MEEQNRVLVIEELAERNRLWSHINFRLLEFGTIGITTEVYRGRSNRLKSTLKAKQMPSLNLWKDFLFKRWSFIRLKLL